MFVCLEEPLCPSLEYQPKMERNVKRDRFNGVNTQRFKIQQQFQQQQKNKKGLFLVPFLEQFHEVRTTPVRFTCHCVIIIKQEKRGRVLPSLIWKETIDNKLNQLNLSKMIK